MNRYFRIDDRDIKLPNDVDFTDPQGAYMKHMKSRAWKELRDEVLERDEHCCQVCARDKERLEMHHVSYDNLFNETVDDLVTLCHGCHRQIHKIQKAQRYKEYKGRTLPVARPRRMRINKVHLKMYEDGVPFEERIKYLRKCRLGVDKD